MITRLGFLILLSLARPVAAANFDIYEGFLERSTTFLFEHLRWPEGAEADDLLDQCKRAAIRAAPKEEREEVALDLGVETVRSVLARHDVMNDLKTMFPERYMKIRRKIATAYNRAIKQTDLEPRFRTVARTPSLELFFYATVKPKSNGGPVVLNDYMQGTMDLDKFSELFTPSTKRQGGPFPRPLIFERGTPELIEATRFDFPASFRSYVDADIINSERSKATLSAIEKAKGFVAVSWTSGKPLNPDYLDSVLAMLEEKDWVMVIGATQQNFEGLPEEFLNHPRIHLLTETIENRYLKLSNIGLNPNVENPLAQLKKAGSYRPGQTVIAFHPHLTMETIATTTNTFLPVQVWTTGSLNEPFGSFTGPASGPTATANKVFHKQKFLAVEKGDGVSRFDSDPLQNVWHVRPVTFYDDKDEDGTAGIIDMGRTYQFRYAKDGTRKFEKFNQDPEYIYLGDPHDRVTDPRFVKSLIEDSGLTSDTEVTFVAGDAFDGNSINHWLDDRKVALNLMAQSGKLNAQEEVNQLITSINALLQRYPKARFGQIVGNHDEWLSRILEKSPTLHDVLNGDFLDELSFAVKTLRMNVWEYIFKHRESVMGSILAAHPDKRRAILGRVNPIFDASRIDILDRDQTLFAGPSWRKNAINYHGDKGQGGKGAAFKEHARAMPEGGGVAAHTHKLKIYSEVMDVGAIAEVEQPYTKGTYGSQGQGYAMIYRNGTKQLGIYNRVAGTMRQRFPNKIPAPDKFFGDERLKLVANDNDLVDKVAGEEKIVAELERLRAKTTGCEPLLAWRGKLWGVDGSHK